MRIEMKTYNGLASVNVAITQDLLDLIAEHRGQDTWYSEQFTEKFVEKVSALATKYDVDFCELEEELHAAGLY